MPSKDSEMPLGCLGVVLLIVLGVNLFATDHTNRPELDENATLNKWVSDIGTDGRRFDYFPQFAGRPQDDFRAYCGWHEGGASIANFKGWQGSKNVYVQKTSVVLWVIAGTVDVLVLLGLVGATITHFMGKPKEPSSP